MNVAAYAAGFVLVLGGLLFTGGMIAALVEHWNDHRAGKPLTFPGWQRRKNRPGYQPKPNYTIPFPHGFVIWPLVALGQHDRAERYAARLTANRVEERAS